MKVLGIKIASKKVDDHWVGYWRCRTNDGINIGNEMDINRLNSYDAEKDAILDASAFAKQNNIAFITEGYRI